MIIPSKSTSFKEFVESVVIDFPNENIPISTNENEWRNWGNFLVEKTPFAKNGAPSPNGFRTRTEWEQAIFETMASYN
jgi:hypothetical protein